MTRHFSNTRNVWTCVGGWWFGMSRVNVGWLSSTRNHNRGHTSVPPCYYEKDRVFIMSKNFVRYLSMLTWDVVWDVIMQFLRFQLHIFFFWNKKENTLNKIPKVCGFGVYERKVLKGISVLKSCSPKFPHVEAKCKQKNRWNWVSNLSKVKTSII